MADEGQKPVESHLTVAASEVVRGLVTRKQKRIEQSNNPKVPKEDIQCTSVRDQVLQGLRSAYSEDAHRS